MLIDERVFKALAGGVKQSTWDKWDNSKKQEYIQKHPTSKYAEKDKKENQPMNNKKEPEPNMEVTFYGDTFSFYIPEEDKEYPEEVLRRLAVQLDKEGKLEDYGVLDPGQFSDIALEEAGISKKCKDAEKIQEAEDDYYDSHEFIYVDCTDLDSGCFYIPTDDIDY